MKTRTLLLIGLASAVYVLSFASKMEAQVRSAKVVAEYSLPPFSIANFGYSDAEIATAQANGLTRIDLPAIGSGLQRLVGNQFVGVSDRGPAFTRATPTPGRVFPLPSYTPCLTFFQVEGSVIVPQAFLGVTVDDAGTPATGIPNSASDDSVPFASPTAETQLAFNPNGLDIEDIHTLPNGNFIVVDEYSPSIAILSNSGKVLIRYTPQGKVLSGASYPVSDRLPAILAQRRSNRGFECIAISGDSRTAYTMTQSPLGPTSASAPTRSSRILRILRLDVSDPLNLQVTGQFLVRMSLATSYLAGNRPQDLKVSSAAWVTENNLLLLERTDEVGIGGAKLVLVNLAGATDVSNMAEAQTLTLENASLDLASLNITAASSTIVYANEETPEITDFKIEGLSILNPNEVAISNDNDFGIGDNVSGTPSKVWVIRLRDQLPMFP